MKVDIWRGESIVVNFQHCKVFVARLSDGISVISTLGRWNQGAQDLEISLHHIVSWKPAWAVKTNQTKTHQQNNNIGDGKKLACLLAQV